MVAAEAGRCLVKVQQSEVVVVRDVLFVPGFGVDAVELSSTNMLISRGFRGYGSESSGQKDGSGLP